ncbi:MAG TPA: proton-conducting transporter membrane subunit [Candidatus Hydrogenedentes bacterium]|nr:proton-conducting transporter membrane subunit [Candidatus Hydrogenedentota bacterium]
MTPPSYIMPLCVALPLGGAFVTALLGRRFPALAPLLGTVASALLLAISLLSVKVLLQHGVLVYTVGGWPPPVGISMVLDGLTAFMLVTVNLVAFLVVIFCLDYVNQFTARSSFYVLFLLMVTGMNGVIVTGDLFNLFVFLEVAAVASYGLVAFGMEKHALEAAFKYAVMGSVGSLCILLGIAMLYATTSTLNMADMARVLAMNEPGALTAFVTVLFLMGFGMKGAVVPFHAWLPDAHSSAPAPISAMLSGVLIKALGVYALCRVTFNILGASPRILGVLLFIGALSMVAGVFLAIGQWDLKRLLAYHSISQIGYVILGIGLGTPLGIMGGLFHLFNHSLFKSLLFLDSGVIEYATGTRDLKEMGGLRAKLPVTGATTLAASMSIAGIPPFNGFWSKLLIIVAAIQAERYGYAFWAVLASILTLASFMKVMRYTFFGQLNTRWNSVTETSFFMKLSLVALAVLCVLGGLLLLPQAREAFLGLASEAITNGTEYVKMAITQAR